MLVFAEEIDQSEDSERRDRCDRDPLEDEEEDHDEDRDGLGRCGDPRQVPADVPEDAVGGVVGLSSVLAQPVQSLGGALEVTDLLPAT